MKIYLTIFGKPRYMGLMKINDEAMLNENEVTGKYSRWVVLKTSRGYEMGLPGGFLNDEQESRYRSVVSTFEETSEPLLQSVEYIRKADDEDIENYYSCRYEEEEALLHSRDILEEHRLNMKLVDVEYMLDRRKLYFYFTAEQRIDFRAFVRDLAHEFRTRIEMRQIGIRDEARIVQGISSCGRPCCCSYWLRGFSPISIKIVKEQRSALNPTKISGLCGRLMCCMSYEQELYSDMWGKLPGPGAKIRTEQGAYTLESLDVGREHVNIRFPSGRLVPVSIAEFPDFKETVLRGEEWGEDKELAEKKRIAKERIAALQEKSRRIREKLKVNAKSFRPRPEKPSKPEKPEPPKIEQKPKQSPSRNQRRRKPKPKQKQ